MTPEALENLLRTLGLQKVRRRNANIMACCPSHGESNPSWGISVNEPHMHGCFACDFRGSIVGLLRHFGWSAQRINDVLQQRSISSPEKLNWLTTAPQAEVDADLALYYILEFPAVRYLRRRGILYSTALRAQLVYHPFDERVMFPWWWAGKLYGYTGRTIIDAKPKIQAYDEVDKHSIFYSPSGRLLSSDALLVEGEIDALMSFQHGWPNVLALGHGSVSMKQLELLETLPVKSRLVLGFDNDRTGEALTRQVADQLAKLGMPRKRILQVCWPEQDSKLDLGAATKAQFIGLMRDAKLVKPFS